MRPLYLVYGSAVTLALRSCSGAHCLALFLLSMACSSSSMQQITLLASGFVQVSQQRIVHHASTDVHGAGAGH